MGQVLYEILEPDWSMTQLLNFTFVFIICYSTNKTWSTWINIIQSCMHKKFRGYHVKCFHFGYCMLSTFHWNCGPQNINVGEYQCDQFGAHMAPGVLKLFATLIGVFKHTTHSFSLEDSVLETSVMFGLMLVVGDILSADFFTKS